MTLQLDVYLEGIDSPIGQLQRDHGGSTAFAYLRDDLPHPLSLSLPLRAEPYGDVAARGFFSNLLFESPQMMQVLERHSLDRSDYVGLLFHLGSDCPGALSCVPKGASPGKRPGVLASDYDVLDDATLAKIMGELRRTGRTTGKVIADPSPLAGVQGKIAVTRLADGSFALPKPGSSAPTTHILKVPRSSDVITVEHEHASMAVMAAVQSHPVASTEILSIGDERGLLITRFDRSITDGTVSRQHQEDFAQALGLGPSLKYQRDGGPAGCFDAQAVGRLFSKTDLPGRNRIAFFEITLVNLLLGNTDNHAKNHALIYAGPRPQLAPVYDVVPSLVDPSFIHQMALHIGEARMADEIQRCDIDAFTRAIGMRGLKADMVRRIAEIVRSAIERSQSLSGTAHKRLRDVVASEARHLAAPLKLKIDLPEFDLIIVNRPD